jgi:hypothetical protein
MTAGCHTVGLSAFQGSLSRANIGILLDLLKVLLDEHHISFKIAAHKLNFINFRSDALPISPSDTGAFMEYYNIRNRSDSIFCVNCETDNEVTKKNQNQTIILVIHQTNKEIKQAVAGWYAQKLV